MTFLWKNLHSRTGLSVVELVIFIGVSGVVGLWVANLIKVPTAVNRSYEQSRQERNLNNAVSVIVSDLREADPLYMSGVIPALASPQPAITFRPRAPFDMNNLASNAPSNTLITYDIQGAVGTTKRLVRTTNTGATITSQILFSAPSPAHTLTLTFTDDGSGLSTPAVMLTLTYGGPKISTITISRRAVTRS